VESLGARLKREREQRKITLDEISLSTKIGTRFLIAIEEEHFDQLPGGIFNKGFVKAYARSVGVDEAEAVAEYELASGASLPEAQPEGVHPVAPVGEDSGDGISRIPWEWCAIALLVLAFVFAVWGFHSRERSAMPSLRSRRPQAKAAQPVRPAKFTLPSLVSAIRGVNPSNFPRVSGITLTV
jgi:cytoskeleton protein RodZ